MSNRLFLTALLCFGTLSGSVNHGTLARFTTVVDSTNNHFSAGTIQISIGVTTGTLTLTNLIPGDTFDAQLQISNPGTLELTYAMTTSITAGSTTLATDYLKLTIRSPSSVCSSPGGTDLYPTGPLASAAIGDPAHAAHLSNRHLVAAASELLCFRVLLDPATPISQQDTSMTAAFTFAAEQL